MVNHDIATLAGLILQLKEFCSIPADNIRVNVWARSLGFESHWIHCTESLSITKEDIPGIRHEWFQFCINDTLSEYKTADTLNEYWILTYTKSSLTTGGRFWLTIEGMV